MNDRSPAVTEPADPAQLMAGIARRDREAFRALFVRFAPKLKQFFIKQGADVHDAEEFVQETMLIAWRKAHLYDPGRAAAAGWLFAIGRNLLIDRFRRSRRAQPDNDDPTLVPHDDPEQALEVNERARALESAVRQLPEEQARVLSESFFAGKSLSRIACEQRLPLGTIKTRARLALNRLRELVGSRTGRSS